MKTEDLQIISGILNEPRKIVIVTHRNPDGDAMGSSLGLFNYLITKNHRVTVITPNACPDFLKWMPGYQFVIDHTANPSLSNDQIREAEFIFCLDFNNLKRIDELGELISTSKATKMVIDHHQQPDPFPEFIISEINTSSTCELVYDFIGMLGDKDAINADCANCLYTGIMTDTGSFRFPSTSGATHHAIAELIRAGANNSKIHEYINDDFSFERLKLLGYCLSEKLVVFPELRTAYISLTSEELRRFNFKKGDTEGIVNYPLSIRGIRFSAIFIEMEGGVKISFRSKGKFSVNRFSREHFEGGGHDNAAGGASPLTVNETIKKFEALLPLYKDQLTFEE